MFFKIVMISFRNAFLPKFNKMNNPQIWAQSEGHFVEINDFWVQVWGFTYITARLSSILTLSVISLERMLAVMTPHFYRRVTRSHAVLLVAVCWLLSLIVGISPYWGGEDYEYFKGAAIASPNRALANDPKYYVVTEVMSLYLPTAVVVISVILISWRVGNLKKRAQNVTATLLIVLSVYIVCFTPYFIFTLLAMSGILYKLPLPAQLYTQNISFLILTAHSAMNPIIYAFKAGQFKDEIKQLEDKALLNYLRMLLLFYKGKSATDSETFQLPTVQKTYQNKIPDPVDTP